MKGEKKKQRKSLFSTHKVAFLNTFSVNKKTRNRTLGLGGKYKGEWGCSTLAKQHVWLFPDNEVLEEKSQKTWVEITETEQKKSTKKLNKKWHFYLLAHNYYSVCVHFGGFGQLNTLTLFHIAR